MYKRNIQLCGLMVIMLTLLTSISIIAQETPSGIVEGTVYKVLGDIIHPDTNTPFVNVTVLLYLEGNYPEGSWLGTCTDERGYYKFDNLPYGTYKFLIDWRQHCSNFAVHIALYNGTPFSHEFTLSETHSIEEINFSLEPGITFRGRVYDAITNETLVWPQISIGWSGVDASGNRIASHWVASQNSPYSAYGIPYGQRIHIGVNADWPYLPEYYDNVHTTNQLEGHPYIVPQEDYEPNKVVILDFALDYDQTLDCNTAAVTPDFLWPPEHQIVATTITLQDLANRPITTTITSIWQDEPTNGMGDGDTSPDGSGIGTNTAYLRAERDGSGNGRMYHIGFTATNGVTSCNGEALVGILENMGRKGQSTDDGALFDSTEQ